MKHFLYERRKLLWALLCLALTLLAALCLARGWQLSRSLPSQQAAERWQGESETGFSQVSCFVPVDEALGLREVYTFRGAMMEELSKAALTAEGTEGLWRDAWSAVDKLTIAGDKGTADVSVIAVGGDFFFFHPLQLLSGSYLHEDDLMQDRVLLDVETAWLLFGGTDLQGLPVQINGRDFVVAGVFEREQDAASRMAYTAGPGIFMSYETYAALTEKTGITAYEFVLPEPVDGFALQIARDRFPLGRGEALENSSRFSFGRMLKMNGHMDERSMQAMGMIYPYWENAARVVENHCARLALWALLLAGIPAVSLLVLFWRLAARGKEKWEETLFPKVKDALEEAIRRPARRRWERQYEKNNR